MEHTAPAISPTVKRVQERAKSLRPGSLCRALRRNYRPDLYRRSPRVYRGLEELTYPYHDATVPVTRCGRICFAGREVSLSQVFAGQNVGVTEVGDRV